MIPGLDNGGAADVSSSHHLVIISWRRGAAVEHPSPASQALCGRGVVMLRLRLFRPVVTLVLVATLHSGFPMAAPMQAPVVPFTPPRL
ncbi:MAG: hypothetical protein J7463_19465 [Roseiflexus sp.]|nr:hypothetical protein [Roseiflexus sp.]